MCKAHSDYMDRRGKWQVMLQTWYNILCLQIAGTCKKVKR